jgi:hypothetical protein
MMQLFLLIRLLLVLSPAVFAMDEDTWVKLHEKYLPKEQLHQIRNHLRHRELGWGNSGMGGGMGSGGGGWGNNQQDASEGGGDQSWSPGMGGGGMMGGGAWMETIHFLQANRGTITRNVNYRADGIEAITTSSDPTVADALKEHVNMAIGFVNNNQVVRRWDPLFQWLFRYHDDITIQLDDTLENGVRVTEWATQQCTVKLIQAHATAVSGFVNTGNLHDIHDVPDVCFTGQAFEPLTADNTANVLTQTWNESGYDEGEGYSQHLNVSSYNDGDGGEDNNSYQEDYTEHESNNDGDVEDSENDSGSDQTSDTAPTSSQTGTTTAAFDTGGSGSFLVSVVGAFMVSVLSSFYFTFS